MYIAQKNTKTFSLKLKGTLGRTAMPQPKSQPGQLQMEGSSRHDIATGKTNNKTRHACLPDACDLVGMSFSVLSDSNIGGEVVHVCVLVAQLCLTLCNSMDCSLPGSAVHGIFQARILEWVAMPFSWGSSRPRELNPGLSHCWQVLYHLSHQGSPRGKQYIKN